MKPFKIHKGIVIPLDRANVDTDAIIPKQFLKSIKKTGFGPNLFDEWRYLDHGEPNQDNIKRKINPNFVLNLPRYKNGSILITRENFGCGSSREHAPWALLDFGIKVIIASSFADIFYSNCFKNGILPIILRKNIIDQIFVNVENKVGYELLINLEEQKIYDDSEIVSFEIDSFKKSCLIEGLDDIGLSMKKISYIDNFENKISVHKPWLMKND